MQVKNGWVNCSCGEQERTDDFLYYFLLSSDTAGVMDSDISLMCVALYVVRGKTCGEYSGVLGGG